MQARMAGMPKGWDRTFRELFCEQVGCTPDRFEEEVFWRTLHLHSIPLAKVIYQKNPAFFKEDFDFIREVGTVSDPGTFTTELNRFHGRNVRDKTFLRGSASIRVSAKRLIALKNRILDLTGQRG
jgi:hypothetical protein